MKVREFLTSWGFDVDFSKLEKMDAKIGELRNKTKFAGKNFDELSKKVRDVGTRLTAFATLPIGVLGVSTIKSAADFEKGMNRVLAVTQANDEQFEQLRKRAKELGATTQFSASEAAAGMGFMAQAGMTAQEIFEAMPDALNLAGAAQIDLATTSDIVTNVMKGMGIETQDLGKVVDVLTKAFISSNTDLSQLGEAMKYAGPVANSFGLSIEETTAVLGLMGNAGIQASLAGTSLRGAMTRLATPVGKAKDVLKDLGVKTTDSSGSVRGLVDILADLEKAGANGTQIMEVFGLRAGPATIALLEGGTDQIRKFTEELTKSGGTAKRVQEQQLRGLHGAVKALTSAWEGLQIAVGETGLLTWLTKQAQALTKWVRELSGASKEFLAFLFIVGTAIAVLGPLLIGLGLMGSGFITLISFIKLLGTALAWLRVQMILTQGTFLALPLLIAAGVTAVLLILEDLYKFATGQKSVTGLILDAWNDWAQTWPDSVKNAIIKVQDFFIRLNNWLWKLFTSPIDALKELYNKTLEFSNKIANAVPDFVKSGVMSVYEFIAGSETPAPATVTAAGIGGGARTTNSNVTANIELTVPPGTTETQAAFMADAMEKAADAAFDKKVKQTYNQTPEHD